MAPMLQSAFGFVAILLLAWLAGENRRVVARRTVLAGTLATGMTGAVAGMLWTE